MEGKGRERVVNTLNTDAQKRASPMCSLFTRNDTKLAEQATNPPRDQRGAVRFNDTVLWQKQHGEKLQKPA